LKLRRAVITAAGLGTRFLPASKAVPKELFPVYDKPAIQYVVEEAVAAGIREICIVVSANKKAIKQHFGRDLAMEAALAGKGKRQLAAMVKKLSGLARISYILQREQKGLGHAVLCAKRFAGKDAFALMLADDLMYGPNVLTQLDRARRKPDGMALAVERVPKRLISSYGIVKLKQGGKGKCDIEDLVEKPKPKQAPSDLGIIGRYVLTPEIFRALRKTRPGALGEIQITDGLRNYLRGGGTITASVYGGQRYDAGDKLGLIKVSLETALRDQGSRKEMLDHIKGLIKKGGR
jgi:UTP--glucose-1-phosphate uridylyltransferase